MKNVFVVIGVLDEEITVGEVFDYYSEAVDYKHKRNTDYFNGLEDGIQAPYFDVYPTKMKEA